jgi:hypothetical protein
MSVISTPKLFKTDKQDARTLAEALRTVPGVGVETATSFVSAPDEAVCFAGAKEARAFL